QGGRSRARRKGLFLYRKLAQHEEDDGHQLQGVRQISGERLDQRPELSDEGSDMAAQSRSWRHVRRDEAARSVQGLGQRREVSNRLSSKHRRAAPSLL